MWRTKLKLGFITVFIGIMMFTAGGAWAAVVINVPADYTTIQAAVDAASSGNTISVAAGTYTESVSIDKSVTIMGAGADQTYVESTGSPVMTVSADDVTIQDLEITDDTQLVEGIRVISPASSGLTVDHVDFTNLGNSGSNAYGMNIMNSFTGLSVTDSNFIAKVHEEYSRAIGIFAGNSLNLSNLGVTGSTFERLFTGIYLRSAIDGFNITGNTFGPFQLSENHACVAGIYIGDGDDFNFDIENIVVTNNTFTDYGRGVYVWNYGSDSTISSFEIYENTFTNSIWSSAIRFIVGLNGFEDYYIDGINVDNNVFTQGSDIGGNVALIDFRTYDATLKSCNVAVTDNEITFSGGPYADAMYGIRFFAGGYPFYDSTVVKNNTFDGGNVGGSGSVPSTGINIYHYSSDYSNWPSETLELDILNNDITGFDNGVCVYDAVGTQYGGLPTGSIVNVKFNNIYGNSSYGVRNDNEETVDATNNWWGDVSGPTHADNPDGTGDAVSDNVDSDPWLGATLEESNTEDVSGMGGTIPAGESPTGGNVAVSGSGIPDDAALAVAKYADNPGGATTFNASGDYWDVHLSNYTNVWFVMVDFCPADSEDIIYYWDGLDWIACSDQEYFDGCITVTITNDTEPSLADLAGLPFASGTKVEEEDDSSSCFIDTIGK